MTVSPGIPRETGPGLQALSGAILFFAPLACKSYWDPGGTEPPKRKSPLPASESPADVAREELDKTHRSEQALTVGLMGLLAEESLIAQRLGKFGRKKPKVLAGAPPMDEWV